MARGNPNEGLLALILRVIRENGQAETYHTRKVTTLVTGLGYWKYRKTPRTPGQTVKSYFSENPEIFESVGPSEYRLRPEHYLAPEPIAMPLDAGVGVPPKVETTHLRTVRETKFIQQLKLLHGNRCQICGVAVSIGDDSYSEGHHIRHLGKGGEDNPRNILILCPNHHVQCDCCAIRLNLAELRIDPRHIVDQANIDWHNAKYSKMVRNKSSH